MKWEDYYRNFYDWAESTQVNRISSITDFTAVDEIVEIAESLDEKGASRLINKALSQGVYFSADEIIAVCECLNNDAAKSLIKQCEEIFTAQQIQHISAHTLLFEEDILELLDYDVPSLSADENDEVDSNCEFANKTYHSAPTIKRPGLFTTIGIAIIGAGILEKLLGFDDKS